MKILLLGKNGQVGWELQRSLAPLGQLWACNRHEADLEDLPGLRRIVQEYRPDIIVNAAAYTAVDKAETEVDKAYQINVEAVNLLAQEARKLGAWFIHYSTDYVFDGIKTDAYTEEDKPNPQSVYGKTKLQGEEAIGRSGCKHLIFRTGWVYAARGTNFVKTMLRLSQERDKLAVVEDQIGAPTSAELIANITSQSIERIIQNQSLEKNISGIYHLVSGGETSWYGFAKYLISHARKSGLRFQVAAENIHPISTADYPLAAVRPANSRLDTHKLCSTFSFKLPAWQFHVDKLIKELHAFEIA